MKKRKNRKETPKEMMERIAKRAEIEEAENKNREHEARIAQKRLEEEKAKLRYE